MAFKSNKITSVIVVCAVAGVALVVCLMVFGSYYSEHLLDMRGVTATGYVTKDAHCDYSDRTLASCPVDVRFTTANGRSVETHVDVRTTTNGIYTKGENIDITYDPQNPSSARPASAALNDPTWRRVGMPFAMAFIFIGIVGFIYWYLNR